MAKALTQKNFCGHFYIGALLLIKNIEAFWRFGVVMIVPIRNLFVEATDIRS
jgi:hypothetical protein